MPILSGQKLTSSTVRKPDFKLVDNEAELDLDDIVNWQKRDRSLVEMDSDLDHDVYSSYFSSEDEDGLIFNDSKLDLISSFLRLQLVLLRRN